MYACIIFKHSENNTTLRFIIIIIIDKMYALS